MPRYLRFGWSGCLCGVAVLLALGGCSTVPLTQVSEFGTATSSLVTNAQNGYELLNSATVLEQMYNVADNPDQFPTQSTFTGFFSVPPAATPSNLPVAATMPTLTVEQAQIAQQFNVRFDLLSALGKYGAALQSLATTNYSSGINSASQNLDNSLIGLRDSYNKIAAADASLPKSGINDQTFAIISTAIDAIGTVIVEEKRREAIKAIIQQADPGVQQAAACLEKDFAGNDPGGIPANVQQKLLDAAGSLEEAYNEQRSGPTSDFTKRYRMLINIQNAYQMADATPQFFASIVGGAQAMAKAHTALVAATQQDQFTSSDIVSNVAQLIGFAQSVDQFYTTLTTTAKTQ